MITLYPFQQQAVKDLTPLVENNLSSLLIGATGVGKTYIMAQLLELLFKKENIKNSLKPFPVFYLTKSSIIPQTREVLFGEYKLPSDRIFITNYDQMRATIGGLFISWEERYSKNLTDKWLEPIWRQQFMPEVIIADECQALKNFDSLQTKIMLRYVQQGGLVHASSATPFTRVCEGRFITLALKPKVAGFGQITEQKWEHFAQVVAGSRSSPEDWNNEAVKRLTTQLESNIVRVKNVKFQKRTITHCKLIDFATQEDASYYAKAYEDYLSELAKIDKDAPGGVAAIWVAQTKFRIRCETIRAPYLARIAKEVAEKQDKQVILASNYVKPLELIKAELINLSIDPSKISIIVGGQSQKERQENINRFQSGEAIYCLFTLKSGGVGLSLHHYVKNAENGKPRYVILPPTWSAIELVQALGRAHRINSISTTHQDIVWFRGTIEEEVAAKVSRKLSCLSELVSKKETWSGVFSRQIDLDNVEELQQLSLKESTDNDEDNNEEFAAEAYENSKDEELFNIVCYDRHEAKIAKKIKNNDNVKELEFELVKD